MNGNRIFSRNMECLKKKLKAFQNMVVFFFKINSIDFMCFFFFFFLFCFVFILAIYSTKIYFQQLWVLSFFFFFFFFSFFFFFFFFFRLLLNKT